MSTVIDTGSVSSKPTQVRRIVSVSPSSTESASASIRKRSLPSCAPAPGAASTASAAASSSTAAGRRCFGLFVLGSLADINLPFP